MRTVILITGLPVLVWLLLALLLWLAQSRLAFPGAYGGLPADPDSVRVEDAEAREHGIEVLALRTHDGRRVRAWLHPAPEPSAPQDRRVVIYVGGNNESLRASVPLAIAYQRRGWSMLAVSPAGFPGTDGTPGEAAFRDDLRAAWAWLGEQDVAPHRTVLHGHSMGGGAIATLLPHTTPAGVVLESTFTTLPEVGAHHYPWVPVRTLMRHTLPVLGPASVYTGPVLVAHSRADGVIPYSHAEALARAIPQATLILVDDLTHNHSVFLHSPEGRDAWHTFLDAIAARPPPPRPAPSPGE